MPPLLCRPQPVGALMHYLDQLDDAAPCVQACWGAKRCFALFWSCE